MIPTAQRLVILEPARERRPLGDQRLVHDLDGRGRGRVRLQDHEPRAHQLIEDRGDLVLLRREAGFGLRLGAAAPCCRWEACNLYRLAV